MTLSILLAGAVFATPPDRQFFAGETSDPNCSQGDLNCEVDIFANFRVDNLQLNDQGGNGIPWNIREAGTGATGDQNANTLQLEYNGVDRAFLTPQGLFQTQDGWTVASSTIRILDAGGNGLPWNLTEAGTGATGDQNANTLQFGYNNATRAFLTPQGLLQTQSGGVLASSTLRILDAGGNNLPWNISEQAAGNTLTFEYNGNTRLEVAASGVVTINDSYSLPNTDGAAGEVLVTDGAGNVSFSDIISDLQDEITALEARVAALESQ